MKVFTQLFMTLLAAALIVACDSGSSTSSGQNANPPLMENPAKPDEPIATTPTPAPTPIPGPGEIPPPEPIINPSQDMLTWNNYENRSVLLLISVGIGRSPVRGRVVAYQPTDLAHSYQVQLADGIVRTFSRSEVAATEGCSIQGICVGQKIWYANQRLAGELTDYREAIIIGFHYGTREQVQYVVRFQGDDGNSVHRTSVRSPDFLPMDTHEVLFETEAGFQKATFLGVGLEPNTFRLQLEDGTEISTIRNNIIEIKGCSEERICIGDNFYNTERGGARISIRGLQTTSKGYSRYLIYYEDGPAWGRMGSNWASVDFVSVRNHRTSVTGATFTIVRGIPQVPIATQDPTGLIWVPVQMGKEFVYDEYGYTQVRQYKREAAKAACEKLGGRLPFFQELEKLEEFLGGRARNASFYSIEDNRTPVMPGLEHYARTMVWANAFENPAYSTSINGGDLITADVETNAFDIAEGTSWFGEYTLLSQTYSGQSGRGKDQYAKGSVMCVLGEPKQSVFGGIPAATNPKSLAGFTCSAAELIGNWEQSEVICTSSNKKSGLAWAPQRISLSITPGPRNIETQLAFKDFVTERNASTSQSPDKALDLTPVATGGCELSITSPDRRDRYGQIGFDRATGRLVLEPDSSVWNYFCHGMSEEGLRQQIVFRRKR